MGSKITGDYVHYFDPAPYDVYFDQNFKPQLITTIEELQAIVENVQNKVVAVDTETTGLSYFKDRIVGISFSFDDTSGYYFPVRHRTKNVEIVQMPKLDENGNIVYNKNGTVKKGKKEKVVTYTDSIHNLPEEAIKIFYEKILLRNRILFFNAQFDMMMFKGENLFMDSVQLFEVQSLVFNADTDAKSDPRVGGIGLKPSSKHFLGRIPPKFTDVAIDKDFASTDPTVSYYYACFDTANTYGLFNKLKDVIIPECGKVVALDNKIVKAFVNYYNVNPIYFDKEGAKEAYEYCTSERDRLKAEIYQELGRVINLNSTAELGEALQAMGLNTGVETKKGMSVSKKALENLDHPIVEKISLVKSYEKQLSSYLEKLTQLDKGYANFKLFSTTSGRFASGNGGKSAKDRNEYFVDLNFQNLTKPHPAMYEACYNPDDPENILGYVFTQVTDEYYNQHKNDPDKFFVEGADQKTNVRKAITVPDKEKDYIVSIDYSGQELKLTGIFSGEPNLIEPFKRGEDLHKATAINMFGEDNYDKEKRKKAKIANFNLTYGGAHYQLMEQGKMSEEEALEVYNKFWNTMTILKYWQESYYSSLYQNGYTTYSYYGRPRRLKYYMLYNDNKVKREGKRMACNHKIQGTAGDIMRELLVNLYEKVFTHPKHKDNVRFVSTVHDEVNYYVCKKYAVPYIRELEKLMVFQPEEFPIPIDVSIEVGTNWGRMFKFTWLNESKTQLVPVRA